MLSLQGIGSSGLRWVGVVLLAAGLFLAYTRFPTRPAEDWTTIRSFELDSEECQAFLETRLRTELRAPPEDETPPTLGEVATKFNLELALVCRANGLPEDCALSLVSDDEPLTLPLYRDPSTAPRPEAP